MSARIRPTPPAGPMDRPPRAAHLAAAALALCLAAGASAQMEQRPGAAHRNADPVRNAVPGTVPEFAGEDGVRRGRENAFITRVDGNLLTGTARLAMAEQRAAQLAAQHGASPKLQALARTAAQELGQILAEAQRLAERKAVPMPDSLSLADRVRLERLERAEPDDVDRLYRERLDETYAQAIEHHAQAAEKAGDADVRAFARKTLATLQRHQAQARQLATAPP